MNKKFLLMFMATSLTLSAFSASASEDKFLPPMDNLAHVDMDKTMPPKPEQMADKLADKLQLSKEQREQAKQLQKDGHKKVEPLMKEMKELREKMDKLRKENMAEFEKILTPEQKEKFSTLKEEMKKKHFKGRKGRPHRGEHRKFTPKGE